MRFFVSALLLVGLTWGGVAKAQVTPIDPSATTLYTAENTVNADGIDQAVVEIRARTINYLPAVDRRVTLTSSRGSIDEITPSTAFTNAFGKAQFLVRSLKNGTSELTAYVEEHRAPGTLSITFQGGLDVPVQAGALIKIPDDSNPNTYADTAVYYYASDGKRYVFPNDKVYFSWYASFEPVQVLSLENMTKIPIGGNVTYRPGYKLVKFQTDDRVYAVYQNGELRWIKTEDTARNMYGNNWNQKVDDINEAFFVNYHYGTALENALDFVPEAIMKKFDTIEKDKQLVQ